MVDPQGAALFSEDPVERRSVHIEQRGDHAYGLALRAQLTGMGDLLRGQFGFGTEWDPTLPGGLHAGTGVRSVIRLRSSSAKTPIICHMARPGGGLGVNMLCQASEIGPPWARSASSIHDEIAQTAA